MRGEGGSGATLICVPVAASGKRKTEDNLIFHYSFIQCSTEKLLFCVQHFCGNIRIFVATTCFVLSFSTLCCLLEISKCLWHWRWRRSESFALRVFHNLNGVIWGNRMWLDKAHLERFLWFSIVVGKNLPLDLSLGQFNVEQGKQHILLLLLLPLLLLKVARNIYYGTSLLYSCYIFYMS